MGGGGGGSIPSDALKKLEEKAKEKLTGNSSASPHIFISFSHEDIDEVNLLRGQAKNDRSDLEFDDYSLKEPYNSKNAEYIKQGIREKIQRVSVTVVYLTDNSAQSEWVNWEIAESIRLGKGVVGVYKGDVAPNVPNEFRKNNCKAVKWEHKAMVNAIELASKKR